MIDLAALSSIERAVVRCKRCPELRAYIAEIGAEKRRAHKDCDYWAKPVPGFGDPTARLVVVGLAPGAHGSNRTGRPFTGDASGDFFYPALYRAGFASQPNAVDRDDGLRLNDCFVTGSIRCAPPQNKPTPRELQNCFSHLVDEFDVLIRTRVVVGLGSIASSTVVGVLRQTGYTLQPERPKFGHGSELVATKGRRQIHAIASYHPSRQNTNTGVLTVAMFDAIFARVLALLEWTTR
jgi:uracil-DNA glycosylase family 4